MRSCVMVVLLLAGLAQAACRQQVFTAQTSPGDLSFFNEKGTLGLRFVGPLEPDVGRFFAMKTSLSGRSLTVTIAARSIPSSPGGATFPAGGRNGGSVQLPKLSGRYELAVRWGAQRARFTLEVGDEVQVKAVKEPPAGLRFGSERWRPQPQDTAVIDCRWKAMCGQSACEAWFDSLTFVTKLEDGAWFGVPGTDEGCVVDLPPEREAEVLAGNLPDAGCAAVSIRRHEAAR